MEKNIDALVLGCTHYPYLIPSISRIVTNDIKIIDSGFAVARQTKNVLHKLNIAQTKEDCKTTHKFYSNKDSNVLTRLLNNDHLEILSKEFQKEALMLGHAAALGFLVNRLTPIETW